MSQSPMVGARVPISWQEKFKAIASLTGRSEAEVVREALAQYLKLVDPKATKNILQQHEERLVQRFINSWRFGS